MLVVVITQLVTVVICCGGGSRTMDLKQSVQKKKINKQQSHVMFRTLNGLGKFSKYNTGSQGSQLARTGLGFSFSFR